MRDQGLKVWRRGIRVGEGGCRGGDVTHMMTSSGPWKSEYFGNKYMKVYRGSRCERLEAGDGGWREGGVWG